MNIIANIRNTSRSNQIKTKKNIHVMDVFIDVGVDGFEPPTLCL